MVDNCKLIETGSIVIWFAIFNVVWTQLEFPQKKIREKECSRRKYINPSINGIRSYRPRFSDVNYHTKVKYTSQICLELLNNEMTGTWGIQTADNLIRLWRQYEFRLKLNMPQLWIIDNGALARRRNFCSKISDTRFCKTFTFKLLTFFSFVCNMFI